MAAESGVKKKATSLRVSDSALIDARIYVISASYSYALENFTAVRTLWFVVVEHSVPQ
jgi:hypothetical protein